MRVLKANPVNNLLAMDCDPDATDRARGVQKKYGERFLFRDSNFTDLEVFAGG